MRPILTGLIGGLLWCLRDIKSAKDPLDAAKKKFDFRAFIADRWDNWLFAIVGGVIAAYAYPLLVDLLSESMGRNIVIDDRWVIGAELFFGFAGGIILERALKLFKGLINDKE